MEKCCENLENRSEEHPQPDIVISTCNECGRRHIELTVDPGTVGVEIAPL